MLALVAGLLLAACTTVQEVRRPDGSREFLIACGASTGWNVCYSRANEMCPTGFNTVRQDGGFNRKEMVIACPNEPRRQAST
ncbi:hypothetical protein GXW78_06035 [Roseomonas terrae]|uniref:Lipoprotein n=1 Tax=Neoroseomonas terrae TaxID=424799 RepID=A0ABS5EDW3_9PROT|nr:hypothetical protein [Neoroseomonas terrae]MBR0649213.1 hypothetical protein [Neoroseomonas terrae]